MAEHDVEHEARAVAERERDAKGPRGKLAAELPQVTECYRITREDCFLIKLHAPAIDQLEAILDRFLVYGNTATSIVVSTPVPRRPPPLPAA